MSRKVQIAFIVVCALIAVAGLRDLATGLILGFLAGTHGPRHPG